MKFRSQQINKALAKTLAAALLVATTGSLPALSQFAPARKISAQALVKRNAQRLLGWNNYAMGLSNRIVDEEQKQQFEADITAFQQRAARDKLDLMEIVNTYMYVDKLFNSRESWLDDYATRVSLAEQVMHQAADPTDIDQGQNNTCAPNALEKRIYARSPASEAKMQCDLSQTGAYTAADGQTVRLDAYSRQADHDAQRYHIRRSQRDAARSQASQRSAFAMANLYQKETNNPLEYRQLYTGSEMYDPRTGGTRNVLPTDFNLRLAMADKMYYLITGKYETKFSIVSGKFACPPGTYGPKSPNELKTDLAAMKAAGLLPAVVLVHTGNEPFRSETSLRGWHEVTIVDFDEKSGLVWLDNQWGRQFDHLGRWDGKQPIPYTVLFGAINDSAHADAPPLPMPTPLRHAAVKHGFVPAKRSK